MPSYNPSQVVYNAQNANTVAVYVGDIPMAFAQTVSHSLGLGTQTLHGIGSRQPQEIQQMAGTYRISIDSLLLTPAGRANLGGGATLAYLLSNNAFTLHVIVQTGVNTNQVFMTYVGCQADSAAYSIAANSPVTETIPFQAMDILGADGTSIVEVATDAFSVPAILGLAAGAAGIGLNLNAT